MKKTVKIDRYKDIPGICLPHREAVNLIRADRENINLTGS